MALSRVLLIVTADDASKSPSNGPRKDYRVLAETLGAATMDRSDVRRSPVLRQFAKLVGMAAAQAWLAFRERHRYDVIITDGEHIGIPLALLLKVARSRVCHVMIGHRLTATKKRPMFKWLKVHSHMDRIAVHSREQFVRAVNDLGIPAERLALIPYQVDTTFWRPMANTDEERLICSAGLEFRDYPTLVRAVDGLDAKVIIGAASHWSKRRNTANDVILPDNVEVSGFDYQALRRLYASSSIVVVPLKDIDFQAGVTTILEAMAMGKPVVVTQSLGQTDVVEDRRSATRGLSTRARPRSLVRELAEQAGLAVEPTGFYVPPEDPLALRRAIVYLLDRPDVRAQLGVAGRRTVERFITVDQFADRMAQLIGGALANQHHLDAGVRHALPASPLN
jgi:glycosyltransferase involved in cell wall biosynthesis